MNFFPILKIKVLILFFLFISSKALPQETQTLLPPSNVVAEDVLLDEGKALRISWKLSPEDKGVKGDIDGYQILRATKADSVYQEVALVEDNISEYEDEGLSDTVEYVYAVRAKKKDLISGLSYSNYAKPEVNWFRADRINMFILLTVFSLSVILYIRRAKLGKPLFIRKIGGMEAVEEAVGRATEMGKPVLFIPGIQEIDEIQTIAGLSILGRVAKITATYDTPLIVPILYPMAFAAGQEVVKESYLDAGKPDSYKKDMVKYVAGEQFAYVAAVSGIMFRERPAANIFMGAFYAESLLLAETGQSTGAIQIAGTANPHQLPFFIASCDYTLMGEELYAASAYLSKKPVLLGSLKAQDLMKIILVLIIAFCAVAITLGWDQEFFYKLFLER